MYKKGVRREKQIKGMTCATHRTYNTAHDPYLLEIIRSYFK
jgi:hypothetical protein